MDLIHLVIAFR